MKKRKKSKQMSDAEERERLEHIAGYDRRFDPMAEAQDLIIAKSRRDEAPEG